MTAASRVFLLALAFGRPPPQNLSFLLIFIVPAPWENEDGLSDSLSGKKSQLPTAKFLLKSSFSKVDTNFELF